MLILLYHQRHKILDNILESYSDLEPDADGDGLDD